MTAVSVYWHRTFLICYKHSW